MRAPTLLNLFPVLVERRYTALKVSATHIALHRGGGKLHCERTPDRSHSGAGHCWWHRQQTPAQPLLAQGWKATRGEQRVGALQALLRLDDDQMSQVVMFAPSLLSRRTETITWKVSCRGWAGACKSTLCFEPCEHMASTTVSMPQSTQRQHKTDIMRVATARWSTSHGYGLTPTPAASLPCCRLRTTGRTRSTGLRRASAMSWRRSTRRANFRRACATCSCRYNAVSGTPLQPGNAAGLCA